MRLVEHHIKYKELHGVDETVMMTPSEHRKLHIRLRKEGKCNIPADKLRNISVAAQRRTGKRKEYLKKYSGSDKNKKYRKGYSKKNMMNFCFASPMMPNVQHHETVFYNGKTGTISVSCGFRGTNNKQILYIIDKR